MWRGAKVCESCRARKMLKNAYLDAKIGFDTAENELSEIYGIGSWYMYLRAGVSKWADAVERYEGSVPRLPHRRARPGPR